MKAQLLYSTLVAAALSTSAFGADEKRATDQRTIGEKTSDTLQKAAEKTKDAGQAVVEGTKKGIDKVKDAVMPDADAKRVDVTMNGKSLDHPKQISAGKTAFVVRNSGSMKQNFEVRGEGMDKKFFYDVDPNESKTLHVDLKPGSYKLHIPEVAGSESTILVK